MDGVATGSPAASLDRPCQTRTIISRMPDLQLVDDDIAWNTDKTVVRCPTMLRVAF